jgi:hypothetical protein
VARGHAKYILVSADKIYTLSPQDKFKGLGGRQVKVMGTLSGANAITLSPLKRSDGGRWSLVGDRSSREQLLAGSLLSSP